MGPTENNIKWKEVKIEIYHTVAAISLLALFFLDENCCSELQLPENGNMQNK